jgi:hypothetical protein
VVASRYDGMTRTESLVLRKKQNPILDADDSTDAQGAAQIAATSASQSDITVVVHEMERKRGRQRAVAHNVPLVHSMLVEKGFNEIHIARTRCNSRVPERSAAVFQFCVPFYVWPAVVPTSRAHFASVSEILAVL